MWPLATLLTTASSSIDNSEQGEDDARNGMQDEEQEDERDSMPDDYRVVFPEPTQAEPA